LEKRGNTQDCRFGTAEAFRQNVPPEKRCHHQIGYKLCPDRCTSTEDGQTLVNEKLRHEHSAFAHVWDANLKAQGFLEAFVRQQKGDT
jgi:hypothetical protein